MSEAPTPAPQSRRAPLGLFLVFAVAVNFITPAAMEGMGPNDFALPMLLLGSIAGQFCLLAIWAVFGAERWAARLPLVFLIAAGLYAVFLLGTHAADRHHRVLDEIGRAMLFMPLVLVAVQFPLWIARMTLACRIVFRPDAEGLDPARIGQFGIQHLLGATAVVAVALGLARVGVAAFVTSYHRPAEVSIVLAIVCAVAAAVGLLAALPCVWAVFLARRTGPATAIVAVYSAVASVVVLILIGAILGNPPRGDAFGVSFAFHAGGIATMLGGLHVVCVCGYTMVRRGRVKTPPDLEPLAIEEPGGEG